MTSNQIAYWRNEEDKRANKADEAERRRHNVADENIQKIKNELEARGLDIKSNQQLLDIVELMGKYGYTSLNQLSPEAKQKIADTFGVDIRNLDAGSGSAAFWNEVKDTFKAIGGLRGLGSFF